MRKSLKDVMEEIRYAAAFPGLDVIEVDSRRVGGDTPLHVVAVWGDAEAAEVLIDAGADMDAEGEEGFTPMHYAAEQGHREIVAILLRRGAKIKCDREGYTPKDIARLVGASSVLDLFD